MLEMACMMQSDLAPHDVVRTAVNMLIEKYNALHDAASTGLDPPAWSMTTT